MPPVCGFADGTVATAESAPSAVARSVLPGTGASSLPGDWKGSLSRVDGLDTESLRRQYFFRAGRSEPCQLRGERWVVVELGGDTLYTLYENSAADSFTQYCESSEGQAAREKLEAAQEAFPGAAGCRRRRI